MENLKISTLAHYVRTNPRRALIFIFGAAMGFFHLYTSGWRPLPAIQQRVVHLSFALILMFLIFPIKAPPGKPEGTAVENRPLNVIDMFCVVLSAGVGLYVLVEYSSIIFRLADPTILDTVVGFVAIVLVLEATRRTIGWSIVIICFVGFAYLAFGTYLPSFLAHMGFSFEQVINFMLFSTEGVLGTPIGVSATIIVVFIIFGTFLLMSGAGTFFIDLGLSLFGKFRGGPAKAAVLGSCLFGMITGSQIANVTAVGVVTIPLMKRAGYRPVVAGSIEALASTGGMLVPPVMGAVAFIIPEMIGGTYWDVCKAALVPGLLFYVSVYMIVELQAAKFGLRGFPKSELPRFLSVLAGRGYMLIPIVVLVYCIAGAGVSTPKAGFWAIVTCLATSMFRKETRMNWKKIIAAVERGAKGCLIVAICCASAGIITGAIAMAGLGLRFSDAMIIMAGGNMLILLVLTMLASLVLGLPLSPVTCYLILAVLAAPALVKAGVNPMAAHLFVFFFGVLGNISPPVAPTSFAAAAVAETDPVKTTNLAFLYSLPSWLVPYVYVYANELLLMGSLPVIVLRIVSAFVGLSCMAATFHGYLFRNIGWVERVLFLIGGFALIYPKYWSLIGGSALLAILVVLQLVSIRSERKSDGARMAL
ncbi:MAG TPA: TRAP transporter permease [Syntrophorhabdales bacterium]|nr:TRAP transporter permease [Syntrophorhabdales bacterium]